MWLLACAAAYPQGSGDRILLMTGKIIDGRVTGQDTQYIYYDYERSSGKVVTRKLDLERVFSITDSISNERLIYSMDTVIGNYFTVDEMRLYIKGEQDAMQYYDAYWAIWVGVPLTAGVGYVLSHNILVFAVPFLYVVGSSIPKYRLTEKRVSSTDLLTEPAYVLGYERTARGKRLFKSLASGLVGTAIGFAMGQSFNE